MSENLPAGNAPRLQLIDADVHQALDARFADYLPFPWRAMSPPGLPSWPARAIGHATTRHDVSSVEGPPIDATPSLLARHLLDEYGTNYAILNGSGILSSNLHPNPHYSLAFAQAYNDWLCDTWLAADRRFRGSMLIAPQDIPGSIREIERVGQRPGIVQILMASGSPQLFGKPYFWPLYEAAEAYGLPVAIHPGTEGAGISVPTASGYPSYYIEWHTVLASGFQNHVTSLICEGVFERFPRLKFVLVEGGVAAFAPLMWRLDKNWKALRAEVPWLKRAPSEYLATNLRFTTQPIEEPKREGLLLAFFEELDAYHTVMYSSDYPHWDFDAPEALFRHWPADLKRRIFVENARELYNLPAEPESGKKAGAGGEKSS